MIKKISKLKSFGIFQDFIWSGLDEFGPRNLIYGWNYSGKTTLSKLFQLLEEKDANRYFRNSEFLVEYEHAEVRKTVDGNNIETFPFQVKVFNTEYIKRIFTWDDPGSNIEPITFYLGDPAGNIKADIEELDKRQLRLKKVRDHRYQNKIDDFNSYRKENGKFTEKAREIRDEYLPRLLQQAEFNKSHLENITNTIKNDTSNYILSDREKLKTRQEALSEKEFEPQTDELRFSENLSSLAAEVKRVLEDTAPKSISLLDLDADKEIFDWVQTGVSLHENETTCKFCANELDESRVSDLNAYYSTKLQDIQIAINAAQKSIINERALSEVVFPNELNLFKTFRSDYLKGIKKYKERLEEYRAQLLILESDLKKKEGNIFVTLQSSSIRDVSFSKSFDVIESTINQHNAWLSEFDERKSGAIKKILNHYTAEYLESENYIKKERSYIHARAAIVTMKNIMSSNQEKINSLSAKLSTKVKGQEELNNCLEVLLHRNDVIIKIRNDRFVLERSGHPATSLSEGEKSAIAFSYFLTELKSLREESKLNNAVVFIDDPISSLDSNHIFQVRSLIKEFFSIKDCGQLFISTHNFEFLSVLLDAKIFGRIDKRTKESKRPLYFVQRSRENASTVRKLPKSFSNYKSEYVGLFHIIKEFHDLDNKDDFPNVLILPNAVRRFLELYTLMKYPSANEVDDRIKAIFEFSDKPYHNTKLFHWFSHLNQFEKVQSHDDKLLQIEGAIEDLMQHIEEHDELHWKGLTAE